MSAPATNLGDKIRDATHALIIRGGPRRALDPLTAATLFKLLQPLREDPRLCELAQRLDAQVAAYFREKPCRTSVNRRLSRIDATLAEIEDQLCSGQDE